MVCSAAVGAGDFAASAYANRAGHMLAEETNGQHTTCSPINTHRAVIWLYFPTRMC